jgi:hypothetical protein
MKRGRDSSTFGTSPIRRTSSVIGRNSRQGLGPISSIVDWSLGEGRRRTRRYRVDRARRRTLERAGVETRRSHCRPMDEAPLEQTSLYRGPHRPPASAHTRRIRATRHARQCRTAPVGAIQPSCPKGVRSQTSTRPSPFRTNTVLPSDETSTSLAFQGCKNLWM